MNTEPLHAKHVHLLGEVATHPIARRAGRLTALLGGTGVAQSTALRLWSGLAVQSRHCKNEVLAGWSLRRPRPCRARLRLHTQTVTQADRMLSEFPATPLPDTLCVIHSAASDYRF